MTHDDDARVADLIGRLGDGDTKDLFCRLLERGMQELIDAELTTAIGAERTSGLGRASPAAPSLLDVE